MEYLDYAGLQKFYTELRKRDLVKRNTKAGWNAQSDLVAEKSVIYVYSDKEKDSIGNFIPGMKVGDGTTLLKDLPFITKIYDEHIYDTLIHVTKEDRNFWDNKVSCEYSNDTLIFSNERQNGGQING